MVGPGRCLARWQNLLSFMAALECAYKQAPRAGRRQAIGHESRYGDFVMSELALKETTGRIATFCG